MPKIALLGNGAIGNLLALKCHLQQIDFSVITRTNKSMLLNATDLQQHNYQIPISPVDYANITEIDAFIVPVKAYQVVDALKQLQPYLKPAQSIIMLHNGMGVIEEAKLCLPDNLLIAATTSHAAYKPDTNSVIETGLGVCHVGYIRNSEHQDTTAITSLLDKLLAPCIWHQNIEQALWDKLAINAVINPLTAIHSIKNGQLTNPKYHAAIENICAETASVMTASGFQADKNDLVTKALDVANATAANYSSMYQDIAHHRLSEIDFINGYICKEAQKQGLDVPFNTELVNNINALAEEPSSK